MANELTIVSSLTPASALSKSGHTAAHDLSSQNADLQVKMTKALNLPLAKTTHSSPSRDKSWDEIEKQAQKLQEFSQHNGWTVNFSVEQDLDKVVIKVVDAQSKQLIRQIPSEELLAISKRLQEQYADNGASHASMLGIFLDGEA